MNESVYKRKCLYSINESVYACKGMVMAKLLNADNVYDRLKEWANLETSTDLAHQFGVSPQVLRNWRTRNSIQLDLIVEKFPGVDLNWLFRGLVLEQKKRPVAPIPQPPGKVKRKPKGN